MDWKKKFDALGLNGTRWQWRIMKLQNRWRAWCDRVREKREHITQRHMFCPRCRALLTQEETVCPRCHQKAPSWSAQVAKRAWGLLIPSFVPVAMMVLFANFIAFFALLVLDGPQALLKPSVEVLLNLGALSPPLFFVGDYWRLITYGYLHFGIMHIGFNMLALSQVGPVLEEEIGSSRFFTLYTLSLIGGGAADLLWRGNIPITVVGASGALFGLIGFGVSYWHFYDGYVGHGDRNFFLQWALYGFIFGLLIGADNVAHAGGLITGAALGFSMAKVPVLKNRFAWIWNVLSFLCLSATVASVIWMMRAM